MRAVSTKSCVPADNDPAVDTGQWQGRCFRLHGLAYRTGGLPQVWTVTVSCARRQVPRISPSRSTAPGHTRGVQSCAAMIGVRDEQCPVISLEQEVGVAARQQPRRRRRPRVGAEAPARRRSGSRRRRAAFEPRSATGGANRMRPRPLCGDPRPAGERRGRGGAEDVQVPARQLEPGLERVVPGRRHRPDGRQPRARPPNEHRARRRRVPQRVRVNSERMPCLSVRHVAPSRWACRRAARSSALRRPFASSGNLPSENTARSRAAITYTWYRGPQSWTSEGPPSWTARLPRPAHGSRAARPSACCPAGRPTPPAAVTAPRAEGARQAHRSGVGSRGSASS